MRVCALTAVLLLALPAAASAGETRNFFTDEGDSAAYVADPGEINDVTASGKPPSVTIHDAGAEITLGDGGICKLLDAHTARCRSDYGLEVYLGDRDDRARATPGAQVDEMHGEEGVDELHASDDGTRLSGGPGADLIEGGPGPDYVQAGGGADRIFGGAGNDTISGDGNDVGEAVARTPGSDAIDGGPGRDMVRYAARRHPVTIDLRRTTGFGERGEDDHVVGVEDAWGGRAADRIVGDDGPNNLHGGGGADTIRALGGDDFVLVHEPFFHRGEGDVRCGPGDDRLGNVGSHTVARPSCERVRAHGFVVRTAMRRASASELVVRLRHRGRYFHPDKWCRAVVELSGPYTAHAAKRPPRVGYGVGRAPLDRTVGVRVKLTDYGRSLLAKPGRARLLVSVGGEDTCHGAPADRPRRAFTTLL